MKQQLHALIVEDSEDDALLLTRQLQHAGFEVQSEWVDTAASFVSALEHKEWDIILCDYKMPNFGGMKALSIVKERGIDVPFILVSGTMGEERAVEAMKAGAHDYVMKGNPKRLIPAIERELLEAKGRKERLRAEEKIQFQATLLDQVASAAIATDLDGTIIYWNNSAETLYGWKSEEVLGKKGTDIIVPKHSGPLVGDIRTRVDQTGSWEGEMEFQRKDGTTIPVHVSSALLRDASGKAVGRVGVSTDITDRKRVQEEIEALSRFPAENPNPILRVEQSGQIIYANLASEALLRLWNCTVGKYLPPAWRERVVNAARSSARTTVEVECEEWVYSIMIVPIPDLGYVNLYGRDITERKRAEEANTLLAQTLKSAQDCISITDLNNTILFVNHAFVETYGYNEEDLIGKNIAIVRPTSVSPQEFGEFLSSMVKGHWHGELANRRKDGTEFPIELWTSVVNDGEGNPIAAVGVARDISERKHSEEDLKKSEDKFRELFENAPIGYHELDAMGTITNVNLTEVRMLGYTSEEMVGRPVWEFVGEGELARKGVFDKLAGLLPPNKNAERTYRRKDGTTIPVMVDESLLRNQRGEVSGIRTVIQDITEKKRAEGALRQSEEKYRSLFEGSKDIVYISTPNGKLLDINPAGVELLGYNSKEEMLQFEMAHGLFADPQQWEEMRKLMEHQGFVKNFEEVLRRKDGKKLTVLDSATVARDAKGRTILFRGVMRDVTKEKQLEGELIQIQKLESIGTLASGIAHDFNNILGIVLGYSTLIERIADDPEKLSESVQSINAAVQRGASLVKQILTFARKAEVVFGPIDVNVMIKEIVKMLRETFSKTIEMSFQLDRELPFIIADATQLHQVLLNISVNARDAMPIGGILSFKTGIAKGSSLRNAFSDVPDGDYAHIIITDTGIGMDDATRAHIFDPFFTTKEKGKGTGLGLSVVYGVMKNHYGFIDVQSEPGKGTTFNLYFPIPEESAHGTDRTVDDIEEIRGGTETILVVEDEEALLRMSKRILEGKGYHVLTAVDGLEALALYRKHKDEIALVVTDVGLPKISGDQLFFELKKVNPSVRVILVSGYIDPGIKSEIFKAGVHDFVQKPYNPNEVLKKVRESINRK